MQRSNNLLPRDSESYIAAELIGRLQQHAQNASIIVSVDEASNRLMALSGDGLVVGQQHTLLIQTLLFQRALQTTKDVADAIFGVDFLQLHALCLGLQ